MSGDLLTPVVPQEKLHRSFELLLTQLHNEPARDLLSALWTVFPNPDDHFIREFQTTHFDARLWELYVFAVGCAHDIDVSRPTNAPDFLFEANGLRVWVEATTANVSEKYGAPKQSTSFDESYNEMQNVVPIRFAGPLTDKLKKRYWQKPHVQGNPFVLMIGDFAEQSIFRSAGSGLLRYLYATDTAIVSRSNEPLKVENRKIEYHEHGTKRVESGFFNLPNAEYVSAVISSNEGTLPKFNRMAFEMEKYPRVRFIRSGLCVDQEPGQRAGKGFGFLVGDDDDCEDWLTGVHVHHNPNALHPLPVDFFKAADSQFWFKGGEIDGAVRDFSPIYSVTAFFEAKPNEPSISHRDQELRARAKAEAVELENTMRNDPDYLEWRDKQIDGR